MTDEKKAELYVQFHEKILRYLRAKVTDLTLAEDLCSEVFLKVYEKIDSFDETKAALSTWVYTIARNTLTDYFRTRRVFDEVPEELSDADTPEDAFCRNEMLETLADALEALEQRQRDIIIFRYYSGMTLTAIAEKMNISYAYVKILHNKALNALKAFFD